MKIARKMTLSSDLEEIDVLLLVPLKQVLVDISNVDD